MTDPELRETAFELMIRMEEKAGAFYKLCALKFPDSRNFWMFLVEAEKQHAKFLREIGARPKDAAGFAERRLILTSQLKRLIADIDKQSQELQSSAVTEVWALKAARGIEESMVENKILKPAMGDSEEVVRTIRRLNQETHSHRVRIEDALAELSK